MIPDRSAETVDLVLARAERELADVRRLSAQLQGMLDRLEAEKRRNEPPPRPRLYLVK